MSGNYRKMLLIIYSHVLYICQNNQILIESNQSRTLTFHLIEAEEEIS